jgi:arginine decarboxylase
VWGVKQLFPVIPIQRLNEEPKETGTLCDLTCDSDGEVKKFIDHRRVKDVLELHNPNGEPYYVSFLLLGAYQDVLANAHNLYGPPDEAFIVVKKDGSWETEKIIRGRSAEEMLATMNWDARELLASVERLVHDQENGLAERGRDFLRAFRSTLSGTVYLLPAGSNGAGNL